MRIKTWRELQQKERAEYVYLTWLLIALMAIGILGKSEVLSLINN